ncbi:glycosyltransferase [Patescibacteria group bacterium]
MSKKHNSSINKNSTILFVTFSPWVKGKRLPINGSLEPLRDFLVPRTRKLVLVDQAYPGSDRVLYRIEEYSTDEKYVYKIKKPSILSALLVPFLKLSNQPGTRIIFKIRDYFSVLDVCLRLGNKFDYFIGLECINTMAAIFMKRIGRVKKVVYYVSDYSPNRFDNKWFNEIYLWMDRFCAVNSDFIWDVSPAMQKARIKAGLEPKKSAPVIDMSNGLLPEQIKTVPKSRIKPYSVAYMGTLGSENGPDLLIESVKELSDKYKNINLHFIGGFAEDIKRLKKLCLKLEIMNKVTFYGFIEKSEDMSKILRYLYIGVAPYRYIPGSIRLYADAGKIRAYCAAGLPVISTHVPPLGIQARQKGAAIIVKDNVLDLAGAIDKLFSDESMYNKLRLGAIKFAKGSTWENKFSQAFLNMKS